MQQTTPTTPLAQLSDALIDITARAAPSVVAVHSARSRSSGFIWRPDLVVAANEALPEDGDIVIVPPGEQPISAAIVGRDPTTDIALLRIDKADRPALALELAPLRVGALVVALGSEGGGPIAAFGSVSYIGGEWRSMRGGAIDARIELDLRLRRAAEGGVALDPFGNAFGMTVFGPRRRVLVIPTATIDRVAPKLETDGRIARGYLGLGLRSVQLDKGSGTGLMVMSVDPKGPGAAADLRQGDIITKWSGQPIEDMKTIMRAMGPDSVGTTVQLSILRAGETVEASLTLSERPKA